MELKKGKTEEVMKPSNFTVSEVFQMERRYVVPLFQRPYVWNREKHWPRLWDDITAKADEVLAHGTDPNTTCGNTFLERPSSAKSKHSGIRSRRWK